MAEQPGNYVDVTMNCFFCDKPYMKKIWNTLRSHSFECDSCDVKWIWRNPFYSRSDVEEKYI